MKVTLTNDEDREYDITEHFQVMYDQIVQSMDWGSGFLDGGEALTVMQAGAAAGFDVAVSHNAVENLLNTFTTKMSISKEYYDFRRERAQWIKDNIGDPPTWESIAAYRERLQAMEDGDGS